jgi:hypothetical protein
MLSIFPRIRRASCQLFTAVWLALSLFHAAEAGAAAASLVMLTVAGTTTAVATVSVASADFSFDDLDALVHQSVDRIGASLELRGSVIARSDADGRTLDSIQLTLGTFGQGSPVALDPAGPADKRLEIDYWTGTSYVSDVPYTAKFLGGNGDAYLDPGELVSVTVDVGVLQRLDGTMPPAAGERWTLQLIAPIGGTVEISRTLPPVLQPLMDLH